MSFGWASLRILRSYNPATWSSFNLNAFITSKKLETEMYHDDGIGVIIGNFVWFLLYKGDT